MRKHGLRCRPSLSVHPSVTLVHCIQTAEDVVKLLCRPGNPIILVFCLLASVPISKGTPSAGMQNTRGVGNFFLRFSTEIAICLRNGTR